MRRFPPEFADLLNAKGRSLLDGHPAPLITRRKPFVALQGLLRAEAVHQCRELLQREMSGFLRVLSTAIPPESITGMTKNYSERLPKVMRLKSASMESPRARDSQVAEKIGLWPMLRSPSFRRFAEVVTGLRLDPDVGGQVLCYEPGNYVGPHNDHHPESDPEARGYIDVQITLADKGVRHQWLVYEEAHHLCRMINVAVPSLITVYWLPFWHYTTPLEASPNYSGVARRWLILGTFEIDGPTRARRRSDKRARRVVESHVR